MSSKKKSTDQISGFKDDVWDDTLLIKAYDNSLKLAREEVARRIAESTNSRQHEFSDGNKSNQSSSSSIEDGAGSSAVSFKVGSYVRATYDDGIDYEAKIISVDAASGTCVIKYIGYDNEQIAEISDLCPSWGKLARKAQFLESKKQTHDANIFVDAGENLLQQHITLCNKSSKKSKKTIGTERAFPSGSVPPPPPMPPMINELTEDSEHLSAMLMSWYMSGYYTGLYQGQKLAKKK